MKIAYDLHFQRGDFDGAIDAYTELAARHPSAQQARESLFRVANIHHWETHDPAAAISAYKVVVAAYPRSGYAVRSIVRMGECHALLGDPIAGVARCDEALRDYPDSRHAPFALLTKANLLHYDSRDPESAKVQYDRLRDDYPDTTYGEQARRQLDGMLSTTEGQARNQRDESRKIQEYETVLASSTDYQARATAQLGIVLSRMRQRDYAGGIREAQTFLCSYPDAEYDRRADALVLIQIMCGRLGRHKVALQWARGVGPNYPYSESAKTLRRRYDLDIRRWISRPTSPFSARTPPLRRPLNAGGLGRMFASTEPRPASLEPLRPDRKLTHAEEVNRDILLRLVLDVDGRDIPIHHRHELTYRRIQRLGDRRRRAAEYLGMRVAHDSIVPPLVEFLDSTRSIATHDRSNIRLKTQADVDQLPRLRSTQQTRVHVLNALAASASKHAMAPLFRMRDDPQLSTLARRRVSRMLGLHTPKRMWPQWRNELGAGENFEGRPLPELLEWWEKHRDHVELTGWRPSRF